jgi:alpha-D-ribose 1-methylphosphonate 5-triphosphate synthase subunit PhnL
MLKFLSVPACLKPVLFCHAPRQLSRINVTGVEHVFQHLLILLDKPTAALIAQNAKENILIVGEVIHTLDQIKI